MQVGGKLLAALGVATGLVVPATADASIFAKIADDGGNPLPLAVGAPPTIRNMSTTMFVNTDEGKTYTARVIGPDGQQAGVQISCGTTGTESNRGVDYHGNGTYTLTVTVYNGTCATPGKTESYTFNIGAG